MEDDVSLIAAEIMTYLRERPMASDSLDGIAHWWLVRQALVKNVGLVENALEYLANEGKISKNINGRRGVVYKLNGECSPVRK